MLVSLIQSIVASPFRVWKKSIQYLYEAIINSPLSMEPGVGEGDRWLVQGNRQLLKHLARGGTIDKECVVTRVDKSADRVCVTWT